MYTVCLCTFMVINRMDTKGGKPSLELSTRSHKLKCISFVLSSANAFLGLDQVQIEIHSQVQTRGEGTPHNTKVIC